MLGKAGKKKLNSQKSPNVVAPEKAFSTEYLRWVLFTENARSGLYKKTLLIQNVR